jgi:hypothetical protein
VTHDLQDTAAWKSCAPPCCCTCYLNSRCADQTLRVTAGAAEQLHRHPTHAQR